tara:strand:+ start:514 stop:1359 length:846 start_codon:yes stop_codon:yes gene_type:complete
MNPILAQIYGTGLSKTASDYNSSGAIDLDQISGADLLAGLQSGEIVLDGDIEKEAGEDLDLSQLTGAELLELLDEVDDGSETLDKMASDGSAEYWDMAGRIMAHAYADEMSKVASSDLPDEIDLNEIDGETMLSLIESGEYELQDGVEKTARATKAVTRFPSLGKGKRKGILARIGGWVGDKSDTVGGRRDLSATWAGGRYTDRQVAKALKRAEKAKGGRLTEQQARETRTSTLRGLSDAKLQKAQGKGTQRFNRRVGAGVVGAGGLTTLGGAAGINALLN